MSERQHSRWFDDYRARGDAAALERVFDRTAPELLRLASHLAPDLAEAEDLVQMTFVTAIERAASFDAERELVPWLVGILGGHARNAARRRMRRADPRELARGEAEPPGRALESEELSRELRAALAGLPELYRDVLARHLFHGERAVDIAKATGRAPGTVRMQISRALEQLRRALPVGALGAGLLAGDATRGLAAVRAAVMQRAGEAALAGPTGTAAATAAGIGGIAMGTKAAWSAAVALLLALGWWIVERRDALEPEVTAAEEQVSVPAEIERAALVDPGGQAPATENSPREALSAAALPELYTLPDRTRDPATPGWWLVGEILGIGRELDAPISIHVQSRDGGTNQALGEAAGDGLYRVDLTSLLDRPGLARRELLATFSHSELDGLYLPLSVDLDALRREPGARKELRADVELHPSAGFRGRVVLPDGAPAEGAQVVVLLRLEGGVAPREESGTAETDARGEFTLKSWADGPCYVVAFLDGYLPASVEREIPQGGFVELGTLQLEAGAAEIRGRMELPTPLAGQRVRVCALHEVGISSTWPWGGLERLGGRFVPTWQRTWSERDGSFVVHGLEAGARYSIYIEELEGGALVLWSPAVPCEAPASELVLGFDASVVQIELSAEGALPADARVVFRNESGEEWHQVDGEGRLTALLDPRRDCALIAFAKGFSGEERELPAAGRAELTPVRLTLRSRAAELASLGLELTLLPGHGLPDPQVLLRRVDAQPATRPRAAELERRDGALWIDALEPGFYEVRVEAGRMAIGFGATSCYLPARFEVELEPGVAVKRLVALELGGAVRLRAEGMASEGLGAGLELLDANGAPVEGLRFVTKHLRGSEVRIMTHYGGIPLDREIALHSALPAGTYELRAEAPGHRCEPLRFTVVAGEATELTLRFTPH